MLLPAKRMKMRNEGSLVDSFARNPVVNESNDEGFPDGVAEHPGSAHEEHFRKVAA